MLDASTTVRGAEEDTGLYCHQPSVLGIALATLVMAAALLGAESGKAQDTVADRPISFNIPSQPLSRALVAYSAATGLEIFYKAALAEGQTSTDVVGTLTPTAALGELLRGTGYAAKTTGPGALTIVPRAHETAPASDTARRIYEPYFAAIQTRVADALCSNAAIASAEVLFQLWLAPSGVIARAEVIRDDGGRSADQTLAAAMRGLAIGTPPPQGMPQPINMVVFPVSKTSSECRRVDRRRGGGP